MPAGLGHYNGRTQRGVATRPKGTLLSLRQNVRPNLGRTGLGFGTSDFQFRHTERILIERNIEAEASHRPNQTLLYPDCDLDRDLHLLARNAPGRSAEGISRAKTLCLQTSEVVCQFFLSRVIDRGGVGRTAEARYGGELWVLRL